MNHEGPLLDALLHRLADCPPEFLTATSDAETDGADLAAIVCDLLRPFSSDPPPERHAALMASLRDRKAAAASLTAVACWLLSDFWFASKPHLSSSLFALLSGSVFDDLSQLVRPDRFVRDADRREELVRLCLAHLDLRPLGETIAQAADRLTTLDSRERDRVLRETVAAEKRAREIREAMALKRAQEAASRYGE